VADCLSINTIRETRDCRQPQAPLIPSLPQQQSSLIISQSQTSLTLNNSSSNDFKQNLPIFKSD
jgi:hypothetical protein